MHASRLFLLAVVLTITTQGFRCAFVRSTAADDRSAQRIARGGKNTGSHARRESFTRGFKGPTALPRLIDMNYSCCAARVHPPEADAVRCTPPAAEAFAATARRDDRRSTKRRSPAELSCSSANPKPTRPTCLARRQRDPSSPANRPHSVKREQPDPDRRRRIAQGCVRSAAQRRHRTNPTEDRGRPICENAGASTSTRSNRSLTCTPIERSRRDSR